MKTIDIIRGAHRLLLAVIGGGALLAFTAAPALAAPGGGGTQITCNDNDISPTIGTVDVPVDFSVNTSGGKGKKSYSWTFAGPASPAASSNQNPSVIYSTAGSYQVNVTVSDNTGSCGAQANVTISEAGNQPPTCSIDTPVDDVTIDIGGVVNYTGTVQDDVSVASIDWNFEGGTPGSSNLEDPLNVTYNTAGVFTTTLDATDNEGASCVQQTRTITVNDDIPPIPDIGLDIPQTDFKIMMNYELGMHCTGFEFAYCCVLPVYNSILAQVVKPQSGASAKGQGPANQAELFPRLLEGDPVQNTDLLNRQTVLRDLELDGSGNFRKYVLKYWHDAQPRNNVVNNQLVGKKQFSTLISEVENNSMLAWNTVVDAGMNANGTLNYGSYNGVESALKGDGTVGAANDNYQNAIWNHLYIYADPDANPNLGGLNLEGHGGNVVNPQAESEKFRLGVNLPAYPENCGPAYHPMGPGEVDDPNNPSPGNNDCIVSKGSLLTYSGETGTIVYTQMKLVENLPIMLTSPGIWEALGLPLTPFEDTINFFADPGDVDEDSIRPYVAMKARLYNYDPSAPGGVGSAVFDANGPVTGFGTAPIDIPNCERCHAAPPDDGTPNVNSPSYNVVTANGPRYDDPTLADALWAQTQLEYNYWTTLFPSMANPNKSDWYARLKSAAINMLTLHDWEHGTFFTTGGDGPGGAKADYPACTATTPDVNGEYCGDVLPQNTRLGHESIICQKCHADNVIAVVKSACMNNACGALPGPDLIKPVTEAIHWNHRNVAEGGTIAMHDGFGRSGGCQGCHPAHRSDGDMDGYPITKSGDNFYAASDNRTANGGCFVGRDVHSNPIKDVDGAETPEHLNAVGQYLADNVFRNQSGLGVTAVDNSDPDTRGIWCTNCHTQLSQELWKADDCQDLINGVCTDFNGNPIVNVRELSLQGIADAVAPGGNATERMNRLLSWLDPKTNGMSADGADRTHEIWDSSTEDALVAVIEVNGAGQVPDNVVFNMNDDDGPRVNILSFCTTQTCLDDINDGDATWNYKVNDLIDTDDTRMIKGAAVPFAAATDGRDHWLSPGEPHCADCHTAPYVEQSGDHAPNPPFNYPRKASLMRYSKGHQDITCQGCHESIHGLYPVTPSIDTTTYAQAASLNHDGSHGPLKCGTCHEVNSNGIPTWMSGVKYNGQRIRTFDDAVSWAHTFTEAASPLAENGVCQNCHGDRSSSIAEDSGKWLRHTFYGRVGRKIQDKAETEMLRACAVGTFNQLQSCTSDSDCFDVGEDVVAGACVGDVAGGKYVDAEDSQALYATVCTACHSLNNGPSEGYGSLAGQCGDTWKNHLIQGRVAEKVWTYVSKTESGGTTCGW